jgi:ankyrin repeat protein
MRACSGGHTDLSVLLYKHNPRALRIRNFYGETCLDLAGRSSNPKLADTLENLEQRTKVVEEGSAGNSFGAKLKLVCGAPSTTAAPTASPAKKINEFAKPSALTLRYDKTKHTKKQQLCNSLSLSLSLFLTHIHTCIFL